MAVTPALLPIEGVLDRAGAVVARHRRPIRAALIIVGLLRTAYYFIVQDTITRSGR